MKKLLSIILLFCGTVSFSQGIYVPVNPTVYGSNNNRIKSKYVIGFPSKDTTINTTDTSAQIFYRPMDSTWWSWTKDKGFSVLSGSGSDNDDSTSYSSSTQTSDTSFSLNKRNGDKTVFVPVFDGDGSSGGGNGGITREELQDTAQAIRDDIGANNITWSVLDSLNIVSSPDSGDIYLVGTDPTGTFSGHSNEIATYDDGEWTFESAEVGDLLFNSTTYNTSKWTGTAWVVQPPPLVENWWSRVAWNGAPGQYIQTGAKNSYLTMFGSFNNSSVGLGRQVFTDNPAGGNSNTAIGAVSQYHLKSGAYNNTSVGTYSLWYGVTGHDQVAIGYNAMNTGDKIYSIGLGTNAPNANRTFSISDSTTHMYFKLDSASGTAPSIVGKDASGNWHVYQNSGSGSSHILESGFFYPEVDSNQNCIVGSSGGWTYMRIDSIVTVNGRFTTINGASGTANFWMKFPIPTNWDGAGNINAKINGFGYGGFGTFYHVGVFGNKPDEDSTPNIQIGFGTVGTGAKTFNITFSYVVRE